MNLSLDQAVSLMKMASQQILTGQPDLDSVQVTGSGSRRTFTFVSAENAPTPADNLALRKALLSTLGALLPDKAARELLRAKLLGTETDTETRTKPLTARTIHQVTRFMQQKDSASRLSALLPGDVQGQIAVLDRGLRLTSLLGISRTSPAQRQLRDQLFAELAQAYRFAGQDGLDARASSLQVFAKLDRLDGLAEALTLETPEGRRPGSAEQDIRELLRRQFTASAEFGCDLRTCLSHVAQVVDAIGEHLETVRASHTGRGALEAELRTLLEQPGVTDVLPEGLKAEARTALLAKAETLIAEQPQVAADYLRQMQGFAVNGALHQWLTGTPSRVNLSNYHQILQSILLSASQQLWPTPEARQAAGYPGGLAALKTDLANGTLKGEIATWFENLKTLPDETPEARGFFANKAFTASAFGRTALAKLQEVAAGWTRFPDEAAFRAALRPTVMRAVLAQVEQTRQNRETSAHYAAHGLDLVKAALAKAPYAIPPDRLVTLKLPEAFKGRLAEENDAVPNADFRAAKEQLIATFADAFKENWEAVRTSGLPQAKCNEFFDALARGTFDKAKFDKALLNRDRVQPLTDDEKKAQVKTIDDTRVRPVRRGLSLETFRHVEVAHMQGLAEQPFDDSAYVPPQEVRDRLAALQADVPQGEAKIRQTLDACRRLADRLASLPEYAGLRDSLEPALTALQQMAGGKFLLKTDRESQAFLDLVKAEFLHAIVTPNEQERDAPFVKAANLLTTWAESPELPPPAEMKRQIHTMSLMPPKVRDEAVELYQQTLAPRLRLLTDNFDIDRHDPAAILNEIGTRLGLTKDMVARLKPEAVRALSRMSREHLLPFASKWQVQLQREVLSGKLDILAISSAQFAALYSLLSGAANKGARTDALVGFDTLSPSELVAILKREGVWDRLAGSSEDEVTRATNAVETLQIVFRQNHFRTEGLFEKTNRLIGKDMFQMTAIEVRRLRFGEPPEDPIESFTFARAEAVAFFTGVLAPSAAKNGLTVEQTLALRDRLQALQPGQSVDVNFGGETVTLRLAADRRFTAVIGGATVYVPHTPAALLDRIENDMLNGARGLAFYGRDAVAAVLVANADSSSEARQKMLTFLGRTSTVPMMQVAHLETPALRTLTQQVLDRAGASAPQTEIDALVRTASETANTAINSGTMHELFQQLDKAEKAHEDICVVMPPASESAESPDEQKARGVRNFAADLFVFADTSRYDFAQKAAQGAGARLKETLIGHHLEDLIALAADPKGLAAIDFLSGPGAPASREVLQILLDGLADELRLGSVTPQQLRAKLEQLPAARFDELARQIAAVGDRMIDHLQALFTEKVVGALEQNLGEEELPIEMSTLRELAGSGTIDMKRGYGKFLKTLFSTYFKNATGVDRDQLLAAFFRNGKSGGANAGDLLGALVKGAGPIFQKILQSIPVSALPEEVRGVIEDVKSRLAPIPDRAVKAMLLDLVQRSHGEITSIRLDKSLGAASVGQAFLCTVYSKAHPEGEEVVVKLLRPDAQTRAHRELALFKAASDAVPGMTETFQGRLDRILEELDLTVEADHVNSGVESYSSSTNPNVPKTVESMTANTLVRPSMNAMVVRRAPGETLDRLVRRASHDTDAFVHRLEKTVQDDQGVAHVVYEANDIFDFCKVRRQALEMHAELKKKQGFLLDLARRWTDEMLFGNGFFHGDLHAGNIMVADSGLTVIDFGNAARLSPDEQRILTGFVGGCSVRDTAQVIASFREFAGELPPEAEQLLDSKAFRGQVDQILAKGSVADTGYRMGAILQLMQKNGVKVPPALFNFTEAELRLQGAIEEVNAQLNRLAAVYGEIRLPSDPTKVNNDPLVRTDNWLAIIRSHPGNGSLADDLSATVNSHAYLQTSTERVREMMASVHSAADFERDFRALLNRYEDATIFGENAEMIVQVENELLRHPEAFADTAGGRTARSTFVTNLVAFLNGCTVFLAQQMAKQTRATFAPPPEFSDVLQNSITEHSGAVIRAAPALAAKMLISGHAILEEENRVSQAKTAAVARRKAFVRQHPDFSIPARESAARAGETFTWPAGANVYRMKGLFKKTPAKDWSVRTADDGARVPSEGAKTFLKALEINIRRLRQSFVKEGFGDPKEKTALFANQLEYAMIGFGLRNDCFARVRDLSDADFAVLKSAIAEIVPDNAHTADPQMRGDLAHVLDFLRA